MAFSVQSSCVNDHTVICVLQRRKHEYSQQPALQNGAVCQQPGEPGGGANAGIPGGEAKSRESPLSDLATVRSFSA